ncbi:hypothetical protein [Kingella potus]|uniref:hypothetical protein n=1 Tax=Kingella potus TaxID=265175 RepID=UPI000E1B9D53|nr:hypothetical protein [Kingella potus]UOO99840.1 hypothetical protein LVJ84_07005 [Kingella potus]
MGKESKGRIRAFPYHSDRPNCVRHSVSGMALSDESAAAFCAVWQNSFAVRLKAAACLPEQQAV